MKSKLFSLIALTFLWGALALAALLPAGSLDPKFGKNGMVQTARPDTLVAAGAVLQGEKIIVAGYVKAFDSNEGRNFALVRYNSDGTVDTTFGDQGFVIRDMSPKKMDGSGQDDEINAIALEGDKIVVAGYITKEILQGFNRKFIRKVIVVARLDANGKLDESFTKQVATRDFFGFATAIAIQTNEKRIIVVGPNRLSDTDENITVLEYNLDGILQHGGSIALDLRLNGNDIDIPNAVQIQPDGKIVIAGSASDFPFLMRLFTVDSNPGFFRDISFGNSNGKKNDFWNQEGVLVFAGPLQGEFRSLEMSDGKILVGGYVHEGPDSFSSFAMVRCGDAECVSFDPKFGKEGILIENLQTDDQGNISSSDNLYSLKVQADKKIIAAGVSLTSNSFNFAVARYDNDGKPDNSFGKNGKVTTTFQQNGQPLLSRASTVLIQPKDGKIIAVGVSSDFNTGSFALARYLGEQLEVPDTASSAKNGGGGCTIAPIGSYNFFASALWLIPLGLLGWRRVKK